MQLEDDVRRAKAGVLIVGALFAGLLLAYLPTAEDMPEPQTVVVFEFERTLPADEPDHAQLIAQMQSEEKRSIREKLRNVFKLSTERAERFANWIHEAEEVSGVPAELITALVATESSFRYEAESWAGAVGPAQVMPRYWQEFCGGDLLDPGHNIVCGARVLAHYRESCEDWSCAFKKYNVGPSGYHKPASRGAMDRYISKIRLHLAAIGLRLGTTG